MRFATHQEKITSCIPRQTGILQRKCSSSDQRTCLGDYRGACQDHEETQLGLTEQTGLVHPTHTDVSAAQGCRCQSDLSHVPLHAKLRLAQPNDQYEQEADRVANQVMQMPDSGLSPQTTTVTGNGVSIRREPSIQRHVVTKASESDMPEGVGEGGRSKCNADKIPNFSRGKPVQQRLTSRNLILYRLRSVGARLTLMRTAST
jgi:hypothetical protein